MTNPTYFTVSADYRSVVADLASDSDYDPQIASVSAVVTFTPVLASGDVILATNASPRPIGYIPVPIVAMIDVTDGRLKLRSATDSGGSGFDFAPVRLLADTPLLELSTPLYYTVSFTQVLFNGRSGSLTGFTFQAPTADVELNLIEVGRTPSQPATGITKIAPGGVRAADGNLIFSFGGVDIPDPIPYTDVNVTMTASDITDSTAVGRSVITAADAAAARTAIGAGAESPPVPAFYFNAALLSNGSLPSTGTLTSGHSYAVTHSGSTGFDIVSGAIKTDVSLAYLNFGPLPGHIQEFSIEMFWADESQASDDSVVLVISDGPFANNYPTSYANAGAHMIIHRDYFSFQKRAAAGPAITGRTYTYTTAMPYDTRCTIRVLWNGVSATVVMHDGTIVTIPYDSDRVSWWGAYGCVELLGAASGTNTAYVTKFNATSEVNPGNTVIGSSTTNTASTLVRRDASGNFAAGTITANLTGIASAASSATTAATATTATYLTGGVPDNSVSTWNVRLMRNSNTSSNNDGMYLGYGNSNSGDTRIYGGGNTSTPVVVSTGGALAAPGAITGSSTVQGTQLISTVATGTAPLTVTSTTAVANLRAATASQLATPRTINGVSFDGSADITVADSTKEPSVTAGTTTQYYRGDKSFQTLNAAAVSDSTSVGRSVLTAADAAAARTAISAVTADEAWDDPIPNCLAVLPRWSGGTALATVSGTVYLSYKRATKTITASNVTVVTTSTAAAATPTLVRIGIYSVNESTGDLTLVASTANDTTLLAAASTGYTKALSSSVSLTSGTLYAFGLLIVSAATMPTMSGNSMRSSEMFLSTARLSATRTGQTDLPSSISNANLVATNSMPYFRAS